MKEETVLGVAALCEAFGVSRCGALPVPRRARSAEERPARINHRDHPRTLVEGLDYYAENGLLVFTEWYHLKRGECCDNACRHCPYRQK